MLQIAAYINDHNMFIEHVTDQKVRLSSIK
jgi:hypothetical protein